MGRSTHSEICSNVAFLGDFEGLMREETYSPDDPHYTEDGVVELKNGWKRLPLQTVGSLYPETFEKDGQQVHLVNMDVDSSGGAEDWAVFSDDVGAVQRFLSDHGISCDIYPQDSIHQTL